LTVQMTFLVSFNDSNGANPDAGLTAETATCSARLAVTARSMARCSRSQIAGLSQGLSMPATDIALTSPVGPNSGLTVDANGDLVRHHQPGRRFRYRHGVRDCLRRFRGGSDNCRNRSRSDDSFGNAGQAIRACDGWRRQRWRDRHADDQHRGRRRHARRRARASTA
jgi:hypothetical protein